VYSPTRSFEGRRLASSTGRPTSPTRGIPGERISSDSVESHKRFAKKHRLPFTLLSDEGGKVRRLYGVPNSFGLFPGRITYVMDKEGVVRHVFSSQIHVEKHVEEALKTFEPSVSKE
jgi:peroxiredoxin